MVIATGTGLGRRSRGSEAVKVKHFAASGNPGDLASKMGRILQDQLAGADESHAKRVRMIELQCRSCVDLEVPRAGVDGVCNFQRAPSGFDRPVVSEYSGNRRAA